ncbi:hypothetical protein EEB18_000455 [Sphingopyxis sp. OPL5]|uniref:hypothetical protein n=1 Tax=Sphingopyxis sp. OPL5 TaxID=2486273 RepID=UPI00164DBA84|nr:hypothetical protein [Sphingopyxis sp. OPL5]QNO27511.1 hypothetical protein EEB18_000455 [Sphingopyxis sp. OPL5]
MEQMKFVFDGKLASMHRMEFYESARFQYSASRLLVKIDNFRRTGSFPSKISSKNIHDIQVRAFQQGSFGIEILIPALMAAGPAVFETSVSAIFSYVVDRVFKSADDDVIRDALSTQRQLMETFDDTIRGRDDTITRTLDLLRDEMAHERELSLDNKELYERLLAEQERRLLVQAERDVLRRMTEEQRADLVTMSAPLLKEMNVPLRRSASHVSISSVVDGQPRRLLYADKRMTDEVDVAVVDRHLTTIDINVVQFNKENGWGKFRNEEWDGLASFSVPADILDELRRELVAAMRLNGVSVDCYVVRSPALVPLRIIVVDVNPIDD